MKTANKILAHKILSDIRTLVTLSMLVAVVSTIIGFAVGYEAGANDMSDYFLTMLRGRD